MIRLWHTSDWHLGRVLFAKSLLEDQRTALTELTERLSRERPDAVLISGDIFDRSVPPEEAVQLFDWFLKVTITDLKIPVAMIPGNHDSNTRVGVNANLLRGSGLNIFASPESIRTPLRIEANGVAISIYGIPFLEPTEWGFFFNQDLRTHDIALARILDDIAPQIEADKKQGRRIVLMLHAYVAGAEATVESERPLAIGGSELVARERLQIFDYVALGHLHRPQSVGNACIRYPGSLMPYSASEAGQRKGYVQAELGPNTKSDNFEFIALDKVPRLQALTGSMQELLELPASTDYLIANLTDSVLPFEAFRRLQERHKGLLHLGRAVEWSRESAMHAPVKTVSQEQSDRDVLGDFLQEAAAVPVLAADREWLLTELEAFSLDERGRE